MGEVLRTPSRADDHLVHQNRKPPARQRRQLRLAHLRGRDHLHGLRDLRRVLDRLDASADVACAGHGFSFLKDPFTPVDSMLQNGSSLFSMELRPEPAAEKRAVNDRLIPSPSPHPSP
jgi:hypothetical protein